MRAPVLVLALVLGASSAALAQPVAPNCTPTSKCTVRDVRARSVWTESADANTSAQICWRNSYNALYVTRATQMWRLNVAASCSAASTATPLEVDTLSNYVNIGSPYSLKTTTTTYLAGGASHGTGGLLMGGSQIVTFMGHVAPVNLPVPSSVRGLAADGTTNRLWASNVARWTEVGGGQHPTLQGVSFTAASDRTAGANPPYWITGPRAGGALVTFTSAGLASGSTGSCTAIGLCSNTPITVLTTTAVAGNQAHLSGAAAWFGPVSRFSTRVAPNPTSATSTNTRVFVGLSSALPLTAGSATPTAHAAVFRWDTSAGDTTWQACTGAGVAITCTDTGVAISTATDLTHVLEIDCRPQSGFFPSSCTFWVDGQARVTRTTNLPAAAVGPTFSVETLTAAGRGLSFDTFTIETKG